MNKIKTSIIIISLLIILITTIGCNNTDSSKSSTQNSKEQSFDYNQTSKSLLDNMIKVAKNLPDMDITTSDDESSEDIFEYICSVDYNKIDQYAYAKSQTGSPEEIVVIKLKHSSDKDAVIEALDQHKSDKLEMLKSYKPESVPLVENAEVTSNDYFISMVICENCKDVGGMIY